METDFPALKTISVDEYTHRKQHQRQQLQQKQKQVEKQPQEVEEIMERELSEVIDVIEKETLPDYKTFCKQFEDEQTVVCDNNGESYIVDDGQDDEDEQPECDVTEHHVDECSVEHFQPKKFVQPTQFPEYYCPECSSKMPINTCHGCGHYWKRTSYEGPHLLCRRCLALAH